MLVFSTDIPWKVNLLETLSCLFNILINFALGLRERTDVEVL